MKRFLSFVCVTMILMTAFAVTGTAKETDLINNTHFDLPLRNAIANVQSVEPSEAMEILEGEEEIGVLLTAVNGLPDIAAYLSACMAHGTIPMLEAATVEEADAIAKAVTDVSCKDISVISSDPEVLKRIRVKKTTVRNGLILSLESDSLTSEEANEIRKTVRSAPATFCVIDSAVASRALVEELQQLALAVWVSTVDGDTELTHTQIAQALTSGANGIITYSAQETAAFINNTFEEKTMTRTPLMIGHRGNPTQAPENSLSGFITAYENGADIIEIDVEITKDNEIVIMHDDTLNRTTNYDGTKSVTQMTLAQIKQCFLLDNDGNVSEETVPTLKELFEEFADKDCRIFVELKGYNSRTVSVVTALIKEYGMEDRVDFISFNAGFLTDVQKEIPGMSTGYLCSPGGATLSSEMALKALYPSILSTHGTKSSINPNKAVISSQYLQAATDRGLTIWPWTYAEKTNNEIFLLSPSGVTTDDVQWAKDMPKYIETDVREITAFVGMNGEITVSKMSYGGQSEAIDASELIVKVIDGEENLVSENGDVVGAKHGDATVLFGYCAKTSVGVEYVLYTQPVTVTVINLWLIIGLVAAGCAVVAAVILLVVRSVKKNRSTPMKTEECNL